TSGPGSTARYLTETFGLCDRDVRGERDRPQPHLRLCPGGAGSGCPCGARRGYCVGLYCVGLITPASLTGVYRANEACAAPRQCGGRAALKPRLCQAASTAWRRADRSVLFQITLSACAIRASLESCAATRARAWSSVKFL